MQTKARNPLIQHAAYSMYAAWSSESYMQHVMRFSVFAADMPPVQSVLQRQHVLLEIEQTDLMIIAWAYNVMCKKKRESTAGGSIFEEGEKTRSIPTSGQGDGERFHWNFAAWHRGCLCCHRNSRKSPTVTSFSGFPHPNSHSHAAPIATWSNSFFLTAYHMWWWTKKTGIRIYAHTNIICPIFGRITCRMQL